MSKYFPQTSPKTDRCTASKKRGTPQHPPFLSFTITKTLPLFLVFSVLFRQSLLIFFEDHALDTVSCIRVDWVSDISVLRPKPFYSALR